MDIIKLTTPISKETLKNLNVGDNVKISGYIYTARDAAHKRMANQIEMGDPLPFDIKNQIIYYMGPCPAKPGKIIGSAGPTTSSRMDVYTPNLLDLGLSAMIGKGNRSEMVINSMVINGAVYFGCVGGAGALIADCIKSSEIIAYEDLGAEAMRKLYVENLPALVVIDSTGRNLYETELIKYSNKFQF